jgi:hypothetical protein
MTKDGDIGVAKRTNKPVEKNVVIYQHEDQNQNINYRPQFTYQQDSSIFQAKEFSQGTPLIA